MEDELRGVTVQPDRFSQNSVLDDSFPRSLSIVSSSLQDVRNTGAKNDSAPKNNMFFISPII